MKNIYSPDNSWYKGNTHIHSTASDGGRTREELAQMYAGQQYDFLFQTDHWVMSDTSRDDNGYPLLWIDGIELDGVLDGSLFHVVCLGTVRDIDRSIGLHDAVHSARNQGALIILAHPQWCGNSFDDVEKLPFDGVEIYNHVCRWLNGKGEGVPYWASGLKVRADLLGFAVDDAHITDLHPGWNGGWIMVNAPDLSPESIMTSIRSGSYYSTCGPEYRSITFDGDSIAVECSPVSFIRLVGHGPHGERVGDFFRDDITHAEFPIPPNWEYGYIEIEDAYGRRAWTNNILPILSSR